MKGNDAFQIRFTAKSGQQPGTQKQQRVVQLPGMTVSGDVMRDGLCPAT